MAAFDVAVVGAGISGLSCASQLARLRLKVVVLEARNRVGGRLLSPFGVDLGASWCLGPRTQLLSDRYNIALLEQLDGDRTPGGGAPRFRGGYAQLADHLAMELPENALMLGCQAVSVDTTGSSVSIAYRREGDEASMASVCARRVVIALPPAVLAQSLRFDPPLPAEQHKQMRNTATWCGDWCKVIAIFRAPFWRRLATCSARQTTGPIRVWWEGAAGEADDEEVSALIGLGFGKEASERVASLGGNADEESHALRTFVVESLSEAYGHAVAGELEACRAQCWMNDPLTFASGTTIPPGDGYGHPLLCRPTPGGIHFAGTETANFHGTVEGALAAADRVAKEVIGALAVGSVAD